MDAFTCLGVNLEVPKLVFRDDRGVVLALDHPLVVAHVDELNVVLLVVSRVAFSVHNAELVGLSQNKLWNERLHECDLVRFHDSVLIGLGSAIHHGKFLDLLSG